MKSRTQSNQPVSDVFEEIVCFRKPNSRLTEPDLTIKTIRASFYTNTIPDLNRLESIFRNRRWLLIAKNI